MHYSYGVCTGLFWIHFIMDSFYYGTALREQLFSKIPHTQDERVNPNEYPVSVVMRFSTNLKRKEERKIIRKKIQYKNIILIYL